MNEQELINIWNEQDNNLEKSIAVNQHLLKTVTMDKIKSMLTIFRRTNIFELIVNFIFLFWLVNFIKIHLESMVFLIASAILYLLMLASIVYNIYNLYLVKSITYDTSIVETQQKIERMKLYKKYSINALYVLIPITSVPFILVLAKGFLNIDLYQILGVTYLWIFTLGSLIIALSVVWFIKQFPDEEMEKTNSFLSEIQRFRA
jgi:hypothetical protein